MLKMSILLGGGVKAERYAFTWSGKSAARHAAFTPTTATLVPDAARSFQPEKGRHAIIEGDNLQVLKLLLAGYRERVKCIYIDPPYNTGKDFVYSDNYTEDKLPYWEQTGGLQEGLRTDTNPDTNGRYHSDWLSMMYSRLLLARQLLREDGVIFVSIDDNEAHNLRKVLDEVFGEENFVGNIVWQKKYGPANDAKQLSETHEHLFVYAKNGADWTPYLSPRSNDQLLAFKNPDNDPRGVWRASDLSARTYSANTDYPITLPSGEVVNPPAGRAWIVNENRFKELVADKRIWFGVNNDVRPMQKKFLTEVKDGITPQTWWNRDFAGDNKVARYEMKALFPENVFDTPKPSQLIKRLIELCTSSKDENPIILDFFAGSGTTFQAVAELNAVDAGTRRCVLVQLPEQTAKGSAAYKAGYHKISDLTIERARRVVAGYGDTPQPLETGFRVWRLEPSRFPAATFQPRPGQSADEQLAALKQYLAARQTTLQLPFDGDDQPARVAEILLKNGFSLNYTLSAPLPEYPHNRVVRVTDQETAATALLSLDDALTAATVQQLSHQPPAERFIAPERAFNTTAKWNLKMHLKDNLLAT